MFAQLAHLRSQNLSIKFARSRRGYLPSPLPSVLGDADPPVFNPLGMCSQE